MYIAEQDVYLDIYCYDANFEYTNTLYNELVHIGTGLPAQSTLIPVIKEKKNFERVFNEELQAWEYVEDHRGEKYHSTIDGQEIEIKELGKLPDNLTDKPRPDQFHIFKDGEWVLDQSAKDQAEKQSKIDALNSELDHLKKEMIFGQIMGDDVSEMKKRVEEIREELAELQ